MDSSRNCYNWPHWSETLYNLGIYKALASSPGYHQMDTATAKERVEKLKMLKEFLLACQRNDTKVVKALWPDPSCPVWPTETSAFIAHGFSEAALHGANDVVRHFAVVVKIGVVNTDFEPRGTALASAAIAGHASTVELLLALGADPLHRDCFNNVPLDYALWYRGRSECAQMLKTNVPRLTHLCRAAVRTAVIGRKHFYEKDGMICVDNGAVDGEIKAGLADVLPEPVKDFLCNNAVSNPLNECDAFLN